MGNCQAIDSATLVIQYPTGRAEKLYWPVPASEIMRMNPGHYVALLLTTTICTASTAAETAAAKNNNSTSSSSTNKVMANNPVRITRIKLLRSTDTLALGHVYRLITFQEVMKGLSAKKYAKMKKKLGESDEQLDKSVLHFEAARRSAEKEKSNSKQVTKHERQGQRTTVAATPVANSANSKSRAWQPSLHSISEAGS